MRHQAGMARLPEQISIDDCQTENIKNNSIGKVVEEATPVHATGIGALYHRATRDWLSNEVFRRVEP